MSSPDETMSSSPSPEATPNVKRRRITSSPIDDNKKSLEQTTPIYALPPPMISSTSSPSSYVLTTTATTAMPPPLSPIAYYPVYTTHTGHFYIASPPLHPTVTSSTYHHPTKILPKLPSNHQAPPTPVTLPVSPSSSSTPYSYYHPYHHHTSPPVIQPMYSSSTSSAAEREQARRRSHSAIEKRRREKLNDKIMQLKQLIPTCVDQENLNKMSILQSTIEYITYLKDILEKMDEDDEDTMGDDQPIKLNWDLNNNNKKKSVIQTSVVEPFISQFPIQQAASSSKEEIQNQNQPCLNDSGTTSTIKNMSLKNMLC